MRTYALALLAALSLALPAFGRSPIPADTAEAEKQVREVFAAEYAKPSAATRMTMARKMITQARETTAGSAGQYILLREARNAAAQAGDIITVDEACAALAEHFELAPAAAAEPAINALQEVATAPPLTVALPKYCLSMIDSAIAAEDFTLAERLLKKSQALALKTSNPQVANAVTARAAQVATASLEHNYAEINRKKIADEPDNPAANLALGRYTCFVLNDWPAGLALLAKGSEEKLKNLATKEASNPLDVADKLAVADSWYAQLADLEAGLRPRVQVHALAQYEAILESLTGLDKARAAKRIDELAKLTELFRDWRDPILVARNAIRAELTSDTQALNCAFSNKVDYRELPPDGGILIGFNYTLGEFVGMADFESLQAIYLTATGEKNGAIQGTPGLKSKFLQIKAKPGYAIGAFKIVCGGNFEGMQLIFQRIDGAKLNTKDSYESPWLGFDAKKKPTLISTEGALPIGIHGRKDDKKNVGGLGLIFAGPKSDPKKKPGPPIEL